MTTSHTFSSSETFSVTHARHIAAKVATDLKRMQRFYDEPSDDWIRQYEDEIIELLKGGYLDVVTYGFKRNGAWVEPTLIYQASVLAGMSAADDDPGKISRGANVSGASFSSYLMYSARWRAAGESEREAVTQRLPFRRTSADAPLVGGYVVHDRTYSAGGRSLARSSVRGG